MASAHEMASAVECFGLLRRLEGDISTWKYSISDVDIRALVSRVVNRGGDIDDLIVLWAIMRDIDGKYGWRDGSHVLFFELYKYFPETMTIFLNYIPHFGCWRDYNSLYELSVEFEHYDLMEKITCIWVHTITNDFSKLGSGERLTNCAKYIPKQGRSMDRRYDIVKNMVRLAFPEMRCLSLAKRRWRKMCSAINRANSITETKMNGDWSSIDFSSVPVGCLKKNINSFMNRRALRDDLDRMICRKNCIKFLRDARKNRNKDDFSIEQLVRNIRKSGYELDIETDAKYEGLYEREIMRLIGEVKDNTIGFVVGDLSLSMEGGDVAIDAVVSNILATSDISYKMGTIFGSSYMHTGICPIWKSLVYPDSEDEFENVRSILGGEFCPSRSGEPLGLVDKIKMCRFSRGGGSIVDIVKCYDILLKFALNTGSDEMVSQLLVVTDIEYEHMMMYMGRNTYGTLVEGDEYFRKLGVKPLEEILEHIKVVYSENGYEMPKLVYYNVRTDVDLDIDESDNMVKIVGYEPKILERIYTNDYKIDDDAELFDDLRFDMRYYTLYSIIESIAECV